MHAIWKLRYYIVGVMLGASVSAYFFSGVAVAILCVVISFNLYGLLFTLTILQNLIQILEINEARLTALEDAFSKFGERFQTINEIFSDMVRRAKESEQEEDGS
jgi:hypothetical protein